jgi:ureidoacrylate peracid hydrolase
LVIDVQNDFCAEGGWFHRLGNDLSLIHEAVERLEGFIDVARTVGIAPIFVRAIYDVVYLSPPMLEVRERNDLGIGYCETGTWGAELFRVSPRDGEHVITKHRYSAFKDTELDALLRSQQVRNLLIAGTTTNVCVESTARDAFMLDYHVVLLADASATYDAASHEATLENMRRASGIVATTADVVDAWNAMGAGAPSDGTAAGFR